MSSEVKQVWETLNYVKRAAGFVVVFFNYRTSQSI